MMSLFSDEKKTPIILILLGPPGSGKGTQALLLQEALHIPHISTGELLRDHVRRETALGRQAKAYINQGFLVPDGLIIDMLFEKISEKECFHGYILDGFPRTLPQAEAFQMRLHEKFTPIVINLELSDARIIERLTQRVVCEQCGTSYHSINSPPEAPGTCNKCGGKLFQRSDDSKDVITQRLKVYHEQTSPLIAYYKNQKLLYSVSCEAPKEQVFSQVIVHIPRKFLYHI